METVQFRDFVFRHNPQSITVSDGAKLAENLCPGQGVQVRSMGAMARTVTMKGCFLGSTIRDAMEQAAAFRRKTAAGEAGTLFLPGMEPFTAQLKEIALEAVGEGLILPYTMVFVEQRQSL
jgi:hypothetical protein